MPDEPSPAAPLPKFPKPREEREQMLAEVDRLISSWVRGSGVPKDDRDDAEQDAKLELWKQTENFDPSRGVQWSTYASAIVKRMVSKKSGAIKSRAEVHVDDWSTFVDGRSMADDQDRDVTEGQLFDAVQRQLTGGLLDALAPKPVPVSREAAYLNHDAEPQQRPSKAVLSQQRIAEAVVFEGLTCDDLATQVGHPANSVKTNLKNAIRKLRRKGLTQHVATDAHIEAILVPDPVQVEQNRRCRMRRRKRPPREAGVGQEPTHPVTPVEPQNAA